MEELLPLVGKTIATATPVADYLSVFFKDGSYLHIYNLLDSENENMQLMEDEIVVSVAEKGGIVEVKTASGKRIRIGLRDMDYRGPEAFSFRDALTGKSVFYQ